MPDSVVKQWQSMFKPRVPTSQEKNVFLFRKKMVRVLHENGVPILAGTDVILPFLVPGYSLHQELEMLVKAGLSPAEALKAATITAAECLHLQDSTGVVKKGYWADLVLLDENPLIDITHTQKIHAVIVQGKLFDRQKLDQMLEEIKKK